MKRLIKDERGLETVEYAIVTGLVTVGTLTALMAIGGWAAGTFRTVHTLLGA